MATIIEKPLLFIYKHGNNNKLHIFDFMVFARKNRSHITLLGEEEISMHLR